MGVWPLHVGTVLLNAVCAPLIVKVSCLRTKDPCRVELSVGGIARAVMAWDPELSVLIKLYVLQSL